VHPSCTMHTRFIPNIAVRMPHIMHSTSCLFFREEAHGLYSVSIRLGERGKCWCPAKEEPRLMEGSG
jgi:hypothetical protein